MLVWAEANPVSLDEKVIVDEAVAAAGVNDFGPEDFWGRLRAQLDAVDGDEGSVGASSTTGRWRC